MKKKFIVGNWKMNGSIALVTEMVNAIRENTKVEQGVCQAAICPPFTLLGIAQDAVKGTKIGLGAQNVYTELSGAYTGEISVELLKECHSTYCIIGHSERRSYFNESDSFIHDKLTVLLKHGIKPILCVGESLEQRESGKHETTVIAQIQEDLKGISPEMMAQCVVAYEPIWAIGTGKTATPEQANDMHKLIRKELKSLSNETIASKMLILYGGSVNAANAQTLLSQSDIDGALVGGASLKPVDFCKIIQAGS
ncbi:MAG: triose-phosphate isomerase [SAR324 cluster bacterium]|nr:triose-phosphate isomerase [SAR324 cluster bacterium]